MQIDYRELSDYRRRVADLYAMVRDESLPAPTRCEAYRRRWDELFATHPLSALSVDQKRRFHGLDYYPYRTEYRLKADILPAREGEVITWELEREGMVAMRRVGRVEFVLQEQTVGLSLFWILGYGGGLFLPFRDGTNQSATFGGGRYLLDTIKSADLGSEGGSLVLDFNFAYNPSCAYNSEWQCPLAPQENWLQVAILAGERRFPDAQTEQLETDQ
jgi:uncharacterized protein (DUF1684 family)